ncbi:MAG: hypothetical protein ABL907_25635 [Hyphomicrobium sp.]
MQSETTVRPSCKDSIANLAALGLVIASAGFGAVYAWQTGSTHGVLLGSLAVVMALSLEVAKPLAIVGMIEAGRSWEIGRSLLLAVLASVAILFSLSAELQLMARSRADAVSERAGHTLAVVDARRIRDDARRDLDAIGPTRPETELAPLLASARRLAGDCTRIMTATQRDACKGLPQIESEAARAERHDKALAALQTAETAVAKAGHTKQLDPGPVALASFLAVFGVTVPADRLSDWMVLVGVLALEVGSALAGLLARPVQCPASVPSAGPRQSGDSAGAQPPVQPVPDSARQRVLDIIAAAGGTVQSGQRALAERAGVSPTRLRQVLDGLSADGVVKVRAGTTGTAVQLVTA